MRAFDFYFRIQTRSLALFRILLGVTLIVDWKLRWEKIPAFYVESGISPLSSDLPRGPGEWHFCILDSVRSLTMVHLMFLGGLAIYFCFLVGLRTRLMTLLTLVFYCGLVNRILIIRYAGDSAVMALLTWACFLPLGACWSVDARRLGKPAPLATEPSLAALLIVAQIGIIYFATGFSKFGQDWKDGTALYYVLKWDTLTTPFGKYLGQALPLELSKLISWATVIFEWAFPILILTPYGQPHARRLAIAASTIFMISIWVALDVGLFPPIMIAFNALLLMSQDWTLIEKNISRCKKVDLHSSFTAENPPADPHWILWTREGFLFLLTAAHMWSCYNNHVAERLHTRMVQAPWIFRGLNSIPQIGQNWKMFAPFPYHYDGWYVFEGTAEDGLKVDPWKRGPISYEKPGEVAWKRGSSWRKVYERMFEPKSSRNCYYWAQYVMREYNKGKAEAQKVTSVKVVYVEETIPPPGSKDAEKVTQKILGEWKLEPPAPVPAPGSY